MLATAIACCYTVPERRPQVTLDQHAELAATLTTQPNVIGWHLSTSAVTDDVYLPDAGLSIGVGAADAGSCPGPHPFVDRPVRPHDHLNNHNTGTSRRFCERTDHDASDPAPPGRHRSRP
ncbi:hypothetical protein [Paractinoplanes toevensis]|uniref:Uncharacterized protein n=1 Tax=Paractinoplanes toevensis TaxID=571911 RepID=A0A919TF06_9ACTN|nr:hypothetical protein [Actinoplanes toevensis]GIM94418.1 hypothetical protein Ato02nite_062110 [Actinoplanes toevensis]